MRRHDGVDRPAASHELADECRHLRIVDAANVEPLPVDAGFRRTGRRSPRPRRPGPSLER